MDGFNCLNQSMEGTGHLAANTSDPTQVRGIALDLRRNASKPEMTKWRQQHVKGDLFMLLDAIVRDFSDRPIVETSESHREMEQYWHAGSIDPNATLASVINEFGLLQEIIDESDRLERRRMLADYYKHLAETDVAQIRSQALEAGDSLPVANGKTVASIFISLLTPDTEAVFEADDRMAARERLTLLAAALRLHQIETGRYPDTLEALTPTPLKVLPLDPFTNKPFCYERRGDGFVLYSVGINCLDDRGSDAAGDFVNGDYAPIDWTGERPKPDGPDDLVVRLPVPELEPPAALTR